MNLFSLKRVFMLFSSFACRKQTDFVVADLPSLVRYFCSGSQCYGSIAISPELQSSKPWELVKPVEAAEAWRLSFQSLLKVQLRSQEHNESNNPTALGSSGLLGAKELV